MKLKKRDTRRYIFYFSICTSKTDHVNVQKRGLLLGGWVEGGRGYCSQKFWHKGDSLGTENILYLDLDGVYTILSIYKKFHPAIYLRLVYLTVCYTWIKLFLKDLGICVYYLENPEGFFFQVL